MVRIAHLIKSNGIKIHILKGHPMNPSSQTTMVMLIPTGAIMIAVELVYMFQKKDPHSTLF